MNERVKFALKDKIITEVDEIKSLFIAITILSRHINGLIIVIIIVGLDDINTVVKED